MWARVIVIGTTVICYLPALLLSLSPLATNRRMIILLPVMGFYPMSMRSGDPGYNVTHAEIAGICFLIAFAILAIASVWKKSLGMSLTYAGLLVASTLLVIFRFLVSLNGIH